MESQAVGLVPRVEPLAGEDGPYILRPLLEDISLSADGSDPDVKINCVEYYDGNLYIGTSASEVLHFVQIPPDPNDLIGRPVYIPASRLSPVSLDSSSQITGGPGVQEIVLLPRVGKACVLCNSTAAFYSLPELSPVSGISVVKNCSWIGGTDLNENTFSGNPVGTAGNDATLLLSLKSKIQVVRLADKVLEAPKVTFAGSVSSVRRDSIACVADSRSYALLDIHRRLTIPLMSISTLEETPPDDVGKVQPVHEAATDTIVQSGYSKAGIRNNTISTHRRTPSKISDNSNLPQLLPPEPSKSPQPQADLEQTTLQTDKPLPTAPTDDTSTPQNVGQKLLLNSMGLRPHIVSPNPEEFLLVIGTKISEPGVGMFVSLDGEPTRATVQFDKYPEQIVVDGGNLDMASSHAGFGEQEEGHVIASIRKDYPTGPRFGLEIQHMNAGQEVNPEKYWLEAKAFPFTGQPYGLRTLIGRQQIRLDEIVSKLSQKRFTPFPGPLEASTSSLKSSDSRTALSMERLSNEKELFERDDSQDDDSLPEGWESIRNHEGEEFARRLASAETRLLVWNGNRIWWAIRNPLIIQLDTMLDGACTSGQMASIDRRPLYSILKRIRSQDARTELEYMSLDYLRQKAGLVLLMGILSAAQTPEIADSELNALEEILVDSKLDPRVVLSFIPGVRNDIIESRRGIWIYAGVKKIAESFLRSVTFQTSTKEALQDIELRTMQFLQRFLSAWRKMKGFGSVPDENEVFRTVDAALLIVLLELDQRSPKCSLKDGAVRSKLNDLVDNGVDCFERAVNILESYHRLFVLSRLYQSRKMAGAVLTTWKRIIEGEEDRMHEFHDGEQRVRDYLKKISSRVLVQEYGVWLANRNPRLGVQVFAEDEGRAPRFEPTEAAEILRAEAPDAVKYYLEHLVFDKGLTSYVGELLKYYLDVVVEDLRSSTTSREAVMAAYDAYRALQTPKPTYHHFLTKNAPADDEVWKSRLRLLQLLSGPQEYDATAIAQRIKSLPEDLLVPETIILAGRQHRHEEALRLLVHKLGDYDTAVAYCLRGRSSIYSRPQVRRRGDSIPELDQQRRLFQVVLHEFLTIVDVSDRVEQTGALLERFGGWFNVEDVLRLVPDTWSVDVIAGFLAGALRRLVCEKNESTVKRALSGAENLRVNYNLVIGVTEKGPSIEAQN
ncbi:hypothetical protein QQS21_001012 [Conoideocrella luteorostrata]|uniref:CNH domain-containing protein n=1 Tax=Conoideocrella luteorostrata TaxID=1105319 RepID=A0AAJ0G3M5_9HYPO|nr:hypothetical protein QQS21_001012 [Conoideocrella luteorostrata]